MEIIETVERILLDLRTYVLYNLLENYGCVVFEFE